MPSHSLFEHVSHGSLGNKIFDILRDRILNEEYEHGQKLNELTLANEFMLKAFLLEILMICLKYV